MLEEAVHYVRFLQQQIKVIKADTLVLKRCASALFTAFGRLELEAGAGVV